jgi:hypothetical protein
LSRASEARLLYAERRRYIFVCVCSAAAAAGGWWMPIGLITLNMEILCPSLSHVVDGILLPASSSSP